MNKKPNRPPHARAALLALLLLAACATPAPYIPTAADYGGDRMAALAELESAVQQDPRNAPLRAAWLRLREQVVVDALAAAEGALGEARFDEAERHYRDALRADPQSPRARAGLEALDAERLRLLRLDEAARALVSGRLAVAERLARSVLAEAPAHAPARRLLREIDESRLQQPDPAISEGPLARTVNLAFREAPLRVVFETLSRAAGLNFVFDSEMRDDALVSLHVRDTTVDEVLRLLTATQQIERKLLNANTVLIYPSTPAKLREHQELVSRSFYLAHASVKQAEALLKQLAKTRDVFVDEALNLVVIKDTAEAVRLAERLIATLDVAEAEVMLEVEVLEVSRSKLRDLGIEFPDQVGYGLLTDGRSGLLNPGMAALRSGTGMVPYVPNPAAVLRLRSEDSDTALLANPRIRVRNRTEARIHIGEKLPVFTTTSTANVGVAASVSYIDVGLKLDVEPSVTLDDEVVMKVALEVSSIVREVAGPEGSLAYQLGTRSASTSLRLQNGETQVLAGLISDEDRASARRVPGVGNLPLLGRLFSAQRDSGSKTEIVLLITPRVIRNVVAPAFARDHFPAGTEAVVGAVPVRIGPTAPESLSLRGTGALPGGVQLPASAVAGAAPGAAATAAGAPALGLPPPGAIATDQPASAAGAAQGGGAPRNVSATLEAPATVQADAALSMTLKLDGSGRYDGGVVEIDYDAGLLEPVNFAGNGGGQGRLSLSAGELPATVKVNFRTRSRVAGTARVILNGVVFELGGQRIAVPVASTALVSIAP